MRKGLYFASLLISIVGYGLVLTEIVEASNEMLMAKGEFADLYIDFTKTKADISSIPSGADVTCNGDYVGKTPLSISVKKSKPCLIRISKNGYIPIEFIDPAKPVKTNQFVSLLPLYSVVFKLKEKDVKGMPSTPIQIAIVRKESGEPEGIIGQRTIFLNLEVKSEPVKVTLDFKDADIKDVLKTLSNEARVNIIAGKGVTGLVTVKLKDVPWEKALDIVVKANGFSYKGDENSILVKGNDVSEVSISKKEIESK